MSLLFTFAVLAGCYSENLPQVDIHGTVVVPRAAVTRDVPVLDGDGKPTGESQSLTDIRMMGPVYLGAFSAMDFESFAYPHPAMGPIITADSPGDTFPYGGTSVGRFDFACYQKLVCRVTTGRFTDYNDVIDYFGNVLGNPLVDDHGVPVESSDTFQQACYEYYHVTSDQELSFLGADQFTENADGDFTAEFTMAHTTLVEGMSLWGFMDAPSINPSDTTENGDFTTCNSALGNEHVNYDQDYYEGATRPDILNLPSLYLTYGDWVGDGQTSVSSVDDNPTVNLNVQVLQ